MAAMPHLAQVSNANVSFSVEELSTGGSGKQNGSTPLNATEMKRDGLKYTAALPRGTS